MGFKLDYRNFRIQRLQGFLIQAVKELALGHHGGRGHGHRHRIGHAAPPSLGHGRDEGSVTMVLDAFRARLGSIIGGFDAAQSHRRMRGFRATRAHVNTLIQAACSGE